MSRVRESKRLFADAVSRVPHEYGKLDAANTGKMVANFLVKHSMLEDPKKALELLDLDKTKFGRLIKLAVFQTEVALDYLDMVNWTPRDYNKEELFRLRRTEFGQGMQDLATIVSFGGKLADELEKGKTPFEISMSGYVSSTVAMAAHVNLLRREAKDKVMRSDAEQSRGNESFYNELINDVRSMERETGQLKELSATLTKRADEEGERFNLLGNRGKDANDWLWTFIKNLQYTMVYLKRGEYARTQFKSFIEDNEKALALFEQKRLELT